MATKFWFPNSGSAPMDTIAWSAYWDHVDNSHLHLPLLLAKSSVAHGYFSSGTYNYNPFGGMQFISPQMAAYSWTTADEIKLQCGLFGDTNSITYLSAAIRVVSGDGATVRGTLWQGHSISAANGNRSLGGSGAHVHVAGSVAQQAGDRIVVELGVEWVASTGTGTYTITGDDNASDYPEDDTDTSWTKNPWVEFSPTIADYSGGTNVALTGVSG